MNKHQLKIAIVEDHLDNIDVLKIFLDQFPDKYQVKYIATSADEARNVLKNGDIDIALLDIDLGDETIFDVLNDVDYGHLDQSMIFITAHGTFENALRAIRYACLNFITKPIDFKELDFTLQKILMEKTSCDSSQIDVLLDLLKGKVHSPKKIGIVLSKGVIQFENCESILYVTAYDSLAHIQLVDGTKLLSTRHLGYYDSLLESHEDFVRIHKSILINKSHIYKFDSRNRSIIMTNREELEISKRKLVDVQYILRGIKRK